MSDSYTVRLEAVRTAIDAIIENLASGEYTRSYTIGDRTWVAESPTDLLKALREEESDLLQKTSEEETAGGSVAFVGFRNEPQ